jgi:uncharacterized protein DUF2750
MTNQPDSLISDMDCEQRYDYFISLVVEERELWILVNSDKCFLKIYADEDDFEYVPLWPSAELAQAYVAADTSLTPQKISLPEFMQKWVPGLTKDGLAIGVFPGSDGSIWHCEAKELERDLKDELSF